MGKDNIAALQLPRPSYQAPNYEKLIWLELKKSNKEQLSSKSKKNLVIQCKEAIIENKDKLMVFCVALLLIPLAVLLVQYYTTTKRDSTDNPLTPYNMKVARPIESYRKDYDNEKINDSSQEAADKNDEHSIQTAKTPF